MINGCAKSNQLVKAALVAGGLGTRMGWLTHEIPKPMLPIGGRPLLAHQLDLISHEGISDITVCTGYLSEVIENRLIKFVPPNTRVHFAVDPWPLGSGGCLCHAFPDLDRTLLVIFGDVMVNMDLNALLQFHKEKGGQATVVVHPNDHPYDSDLVKQDTTNRIVTLLRKPHPPNLYARNLVVAGVFVLEPDLVRSIPSVHPSDLVHDVLIPAVEKGVPIYGYATTEYLKDMGTPSRYKTVCEDWERGYVNTLHLSNIRPAAFLDRDGVINRHVGLVSSPELLELLPGSAEAIRRLNRSGILVVVTTNQSVVARGLCDEDGLAAIHAYLEMALGKEGAYLDALYYCPHHPDRGFKGENLHYKIFCNCRKPAPGMIYAAMQDLPIDLKRSVFFGDTMRDVETAARFGIPCYLIGTSDEMPLNLDGINVKVQRFVSLQEAVSAWLDTNPSLYCKVKSK